MNNELRALKIRVTKTDDQWTIDGPGYAIDEVARVFKNRTDFTAGDDGVDSDWLGVHASVAIYANAEETTADLICLLEDMGAIVNARF